MSKTVIVDGRPILIAKAAREAGLRYSTLANRLRKARGDREILRALRMPPMSRERAGKLGKEQSPWR